MKKSEIVIFVFVLAIFSMLFGCAATGPKRSSVQPLMSFNPENWQIECGALVQALADLAPLEVIKTDQRFMGKENPIEKKYVGKQVIWELKFQSIEKDKSGKESLRFDLEPAGIRYRFFSGKPVMMSLSSAAGTWESWAKIKQGSLVRITGQVGQIFFATMTPGDNPNRKIPVAIVMIENVKPEASIP
jgi:hypothetical protein